MTTQHPAAGTPAAAEPEVRHRSGAVARMLRMPVATLRVWERRYGVTRPAVSASGQRLYAAGDVRRLALVKQLTDLGHAIGSLARLDMRQLQEVASTHAGALAARVPASPASPDKTAGASRAAGPAQAPCRVAVIGSALAARVARALDAPGRVPGVQVLGPYTDAAAAAEALRGAAVDLLLVAEPRLHEGWWAALQGAAPGLAAGPVAVVYRFAAERTCATLAAEGVALLRDPQGDTALGQWLLDRLPQGARAAARAQGSAGGPADDDALGQAPARRWDDAALADFAGLSSTIACECPRHVAELLMQLSHFEAYSAECRQRSGPDGGLHAYLQAVAGRTRAMFETALERVALHEGILVPPLPPSPPPTTSGGGA
jgi:MerR family transcriptional regulator, light-induced transcriptional regulator